MFVPTSEQTEELREWLFGGDWHEPAPEWYDGLSENEQIAATVAAELHGTPWHYSPEETKHRSSKLREISNLNSQNALKHHSNV